MGERRILVIGSQCEALGDLPFLPKAAEDLYAILTDPERGSCDIGHGVNPEDTEDFYLMPRDAKHPPKSETAVHLINLIKETHRVAPGAVDGLGVLVDACYSGKAGFGAAQAWVSGLKGMLRFEMLTAAADRPAANGCFSQKLAELLGAGVSTVPFEHLHCLHLRPLIEGSCPNQVPQHPSYNPDETLWLARNAGCILEPWAQTPLADEIQRLTLAYQPTAALGEVVARSRAERCLAVVGEAGTGKSALAAALAWPKVAEGIVPAGFVQAIVLLTEATTPQELARVLTEQLARAVPGSAAWLFPRRRLARFHGDVESSAGRHRHRDAERHRPVVIVGDTPDRRAMLHRAAFVIAQQRRDAIVLARRKPRDAELEIVCKQIAGGAVDHAGRGNRLDPVVAGGDFERFGVTTL